MIVWCICYNNYNILCWFLVVVMHSLVQVTCGDSTLLKARINDMASLSANSAQDYGEICPANNNVKHSNRVEDKSKSGFGNFTKYSKKVKRRTRDHSYAEETSRSDLELPMRLNADETPLRKVAKKASLVRNQQSKKRRKEVFSSKNCTKVLAQVGSTVVMNCEVNDITENTVTWIRRKDYSLLSVGLVTYSADPRFRSAHGKHIKDWALHIRYSNVSDSGYYECQVPTHPPTSIFIKLLVIEAYADILGEPEKIVQQGSLLRLTCLIKGSTEPPTYVFWYYDDRMINYDLNGITVSQSRHSSELLVARASPQHAGNYTCVPANARPASVVVHVVLSEAPAAMQHGNTSSGNQPPATTILQFFSIVLLALTLRNIVL